TVRLTGDIIVHEGRLAQGILKVGDTVKAVIDEERRRDIARNHTATHLLQAALRQVLGAHVQQRGSLVAPDRLRFDFSHLTAMTAEEIRAVQRIVNENIRRNLEVQAVEMEYRRALAEGAVALFDEKYGDVVRVLRIGEPPVSTELCGGTHVGFTGEIGYFHIVSESSIGAGLRRIEAVTGRVAEEFISGRLADLAEVALILEAKPDEIVPKARTVVDELESRRRRLAELEMELARVQARSLARRRVNGIMLVAGQLPPVDPQVLRSLSDQIRDEIGSGVVVLGTVWGDRPSLVVNVSSDLTGRVSAVDIARRLAKVIGGGGGGRANFAQAGGKDREKLGEALRLVEELIPGEN
ncbi:MAG: DHHA1 domain-containing protein, partial [Dehalococcoidales bacterium]|nr:DHHA1 domain-containing protein [Dehalococcoidales bacterium]